MDRGDVGTVDTPVDLCAVKAPGLHRKRHVLGAVVVMVERGALCRRVEDTETDHRMFVLSLRRRTAAACPVLDCPSKNAVSVHRTERELGRGRRAGGADCPPLRAALALRTSN